MWSSASSSIVEAVAAEAAGLVGERALASARGGPSGSSGSSRKSVERLSSAEVSEKYGFSVVAPTRTSSPSSTCGSSASCWVLLKRCTSSRKRIVPWPALAEPVLGPLDDLADVLHARVHRAHRLERLVGRARDEPGDRRLAGAGRAPEDHRREAVTLDERAQRPARREQVALADDLVERPGPQPGREGRPGLQPLLGRRREQISRHRPTLRPHPDFGVRTSGGERQAG